MLSSGSEENVATQCFATVGSRDAEVECENGSPCGDPERDNPYTGMRGEHVRLNYTMGGIAMHK